VRSANAGAIVWAWVRGTEAVEFAASGNCMSVGVRIRVGVGGRESMQVYGWDMCRAE
jgi:hypothetical protein